MIQTCLRIIVMRHS